MSICSIILLALCSFSNVQGEGSPSINVYKATEQSYVPNLFNTGPIKVGNDAELIFLDLPGLGTRENPFIIRSYNITSSSANLIEISNISLHVIIQDNHLNGVSKENDGIKLHRADNVKIKSNNILNTKIGINLDLSTNIIISNNTISESSSYSFKFSGTSHLNLVVWNNILGTTTDGSRASDDGLQNTFHYNFWEAENYQDEDENDIADTSVKIEGSADNYDITPLAEKHLSSSHSHSPIKLLQPNVAEKRLGMVKILWTPSVDSHDHMVKYSLYYSFDSKKSWTLLADNLEVNYFDWDVTNQDSGEYFLKIEVTDEIEMATVTVFESSFAIGDYEINDDDLGNELFAGGPLGFFIPFLLIILLVIFSTFQIVRRIGKRALSRRVLEGILGIAATPTLLQIISDDADEFEREDFIPPELLKFKFLLNPVRLGIMKILFDYTSIAAFELRDLIGISWGKFTPHIDSLIDKGMISSSNDFIDGKPRKIVFIEERGIMHFNELQKILRTVVN